MDIRCRKTECKFNDRYTCKAKGIKINEEVKCDSFEKGEKKSDATKRIWNKAPQYAPQRDSKTLSIDCCAECLFNNNGKCVSNGITVNALKEFPYCISFLKK